MEESVEILGGVCSAALSSICCWGPLLLAFFGVSSAVLAPFTKYRWIFIILASVFLGRALYLSYYTQNRRNIILIWIMMAIALGFILFPYFLGLL